MRLDDIIHKIVEGKRLKIRSWRVGLAHLEISFNWRELFSIGGEDFILLKTKSLVHYDILLYWRNEVSGEYVKKAL